MSRKIKELIQRDYEESFKDVDEFIIISLRGISGKENNQMRGDLLSKDIHLQVVNNSLASRVFSQTGREQVVEYLTGPSAIAYGSDNIVDLAKVLMDWDKKLEKFQIKGGYLEGKALDSESARALSKMPTRRELQGSLVALAQSPGGNVLNLLGAGAGRIAGCIKSLIEKMEAA